MNGEENIFITEKHNKTKTVTKGDVFWCLPLVYSVLTTTYYSVVSCQNPNNSKHHHQQYTAGNRGRA